MTKNKDKILAIVLVSPSIIALAIFVYLFIAWSVRVSVSAKLLGRVSQPA